MKTSFDQFHDEQSRSCETFPHNTPFGKCKRICISICRVFHTFLYKLHVLKVLNSKHKALPKISLFAKFLKSCDRFYAALIVHNNPG